VNALLFFMEPPDSAATIEFSDKLPRSSIMANQESALELTGQVAMGWLMDCADDPKRGTYMEAVADLTGRVVQGAIAAASAAEREPLEFLISRSAAPSAAVPAPGGHPLAI
jgi:hypothetical protein